MAPDEQGSHPVDESTTDGVLVHAFRATGNVVAFEILLKRYQRPLYGFIRRQVGDRAEAEDLYQAVVMRLLDRIDACHEPEHFKAWAFGVAANVCRYEGRRQMRRPEAADAGAHALAAPLTSSPEQGAQDAQVRGRIEQALAALSPPQREAFVLYQFTHLSYDEIAQALGLSVGTVKSRMNAALTSLRAHLAGLQEVAR